MSDTHLIDAVKAGDFSTVGHLVDSGADINQQDEHGWTPLNYAAGKGNEAMVNLLLARGADMWIVGRDQRTPYMIALAAGQVDVAKSLRAAEEKSGKAVAREPRKYCKAYHLRDLRVFPGFSESKINWKAKEVRNADNGNPGEHEFADDDVVFVHQDFTVTQSMWHNENVIFNQVTDEWKRFCEETLRFIVPDDIDLVGNVKSTGQGST